MSHKRGDSGTSANLLAITRHDEYFLPGGDLYVMVDHVQFRIHKYFFERESPYFRRTLAIPASPGAQKPGTSESTALVLDDIKPSEFARFLWVFYNPKFSIYNASVDEWATILRLAHRWTFHEVKDLAVRELQKLDSPDIDRIVLYHDCEVDRNLLLSQYAALCKREQPLELDEGKKLGLETTLMIASAREHARGCVLPSGGRSPIAATLALSEMVSLIRQLFRIDPPPEDVLQVMNTIPAAVTGATATTAATTSSTTTTTMTNGTATTSSTTNDATASTTTNGSGSGSTTLNGSATTPTSNQSTTGSTTVNGQGTPAAANGQAAATANSPSSGNSNNGAKPGAGQTAMPVAGRPAPAPPVSNAIATPPPLEAPPKPPLKNDANTSETGTNGAGESTTSLQSNGAQRSGSNDADYDAEVESIEDDNNKAGTNKNKNKNKGNKAKNAAQNGIAAADRNTPSPINTALGGQKDLLDMGIGDMNGDWSATPTKGDQNGGRSSTPTRGKKGGWLNSMGGRKVAG